MNLFNEKGLGVRKNKVLSSAKKNSSKLSNLKELSQLEKIVGEFMQYWGFKEIHGRIWTHLYTSFQPLDSVELMKRLKVSKGLMSLALRELLRYKVIQKEHIGRHGSTFYSARTDLLSVINHVLLHREVKMLSKALSAARNLNKIESNKAQAHQLSLEKVNSLVDLTEMALGLLKGLMQQDPFQLSTIEKLTEEKQ